MLRSAELAARFDISPRLDCEGRHLGAIAFYNLDVYLVLLVGALLAAAFLYAVFLLLARCVRGGARRTKEEKED